jgi:hypothetical protein
MSIADIETEAYERYVQYCLRMEIPPMPFIRWEIVRTYVVRPD